MRKSVDRAYQKAVQEGTIITHVSDEDLAAAAARAADDADRDEGCEGDDPPLDPEETRLRGLIERAPK